MLEIGAIVVAAAGGAVGWSMFKKSRAHTRWRAVLEEAAKKLDGRASPATMFDAPELRATVKDVLVTVKLQSIHDPKNGVAIAEAKLPDAAERLRIYVGWDVKKVPPGLEHVPEVEYPRASGLDGKLLVRASDRSIADRFTDAAVIDLVDIRREALAKAIEVIARGGYIHVIAHGLSESAFMVERMVGVTANLVRLVASTLPGAAVADASRVADAEKIADTGRVADASKVADASRVADETRCTLCVERRNAGEQWVQCARCRAPYHAACFTQATGCVAEGCSETRAEPMS
jgi:hypothetical protein